MQNWPGNYRANMIGSLKTCSLVKTLECKTLPPLQAKLPLLNKGEQVCPSGSVLTSWWLQTLILCAKAANNLFIQCLEVNISQRLEVNGIQVIFLTIYSHTCEGETLFLVTNETALKIPYSTSSYWNCNRVSFRYVRLWQAFIQNPVSGTISQYLFLRKSRCLLHAKLPSRIWCEQCLIDIMKYIIINCMRWPVT